MRWIITYLVLILALILVGAYMLNEAASKPAWDGTWDCRPGEVYTVKECP